MNTDTLESYGKRCQTDLGQATHSPEAVIQWCYDNPPRKPLPKATGIRDWHFYTERRIGQCLNSIAGKGYADGLATAVLRQWVQQHCPELWSMYERHEQEVEKRIAEVRLNEPELHPTCLQEENPA